MSFSRDVQFAARLLARDRGFTCVAVLALALGMAVNSTFFSIVNAITLRGPIAAPAGLVHVGTRAANGAPAGMSYADFDDVSRAARTLSAMGAYTNTLAALADDDRAAERVAGAYITANALTILREQPLAGRGLFADDDRDDAAPVVLISETLWRTRYAADPSLVGRNIRINGVPATVIGILRDGFRFPNDALFWMPLASGPDLRSQPRSARSVGVFARLAADASAPQAESELNGILARLAQTYPESNRGIQAIVVPINRQFTPPLMQPAWLAFIVAGALVLIIACANVANLLLARSIRRSGEMAVRLSLGASRGRIVRQLLVESGLLAVLGAGTGLALSVAGIRAYASMIPEGTMPSFMTPTIDGRVLAVLAAAACGTVFLFGFVPALVSSRMHPGRLLNDRGTAGTSRAARRWTTAFLTAQFALTFIFIAGLVLDLRTFLDALQRERVVDTANLMTASLTLPAERYPTAETRYSFLERLTASLDGSGAAAVSMATVLPLANGTPRKLAVDGRAPVANDQLPDVRVVGVAPRYFQAVGTAPVIGREFTALDGAPGEAAAIVNERLAAMLFADGTAIGRRVALPAQGASAATDWMTIVGVAPTIQQGPGDDPTPVLYVPLRSTMPMTVALLVKGSDGAAPLAPLLRERVRALDRDLPLARVMSMEQAMIDAGWNARLSNALFRSIAVIGMMLALVGLYAVTAYAIEQRRRELGVRLALGARGRQLAWLLMRRVFAQLGLAAGVGVLLTMAWDRAFSTGSARMADPGVLVAAVLVIAVVGCLAALVPVRRAARLDPVASLRAD